MTVSAYPVAMISGGGRGIGAAIAAELMQHGWAVSLGCRTPEEVTVTNPGQQLVCHYDALASLSAKRVKSAQSGVYTMSKFSALVLTHALRQAGDGEGIRACAICPGLVATEMGTALTDVPAEKMTQPADIALLVRTVLMLPNSASVAEIPVNWAVEENY